MLVLTRKRDESIMIGDHIRIVVVDVRGDQVKLGIDAPRHIAVHREEIYREIQEENRRAALRASVPVDQVDDLLRQAPFSASETTTGRQGTHPPRGQHPPEKEKNLPLSPSQREASNPFVEQEP